jgi:hypothetical protein
MTTLSRFFISLFVFMVLALPAVGTFAQTSPANPTSPGNPTSPANPTSPGTGGSALVNPLQVDSLEELFGKILDAIIQIGTMVLVLMIVFVGFKFVVARGNPEEISSARSALMWTVIGGLILLGAKAIQLVITETVGNL